MKDGRSDKENSNTYSARRDLGGQTRAIVHGQGEMNSSEHAGNMNKGFHCERKVHSNLARNYDKNQTTGRKLDKIRYSTEGY